MRYYGTKDKIKKEHYEYAFAKAYTKVKSLLPGPHRKFYALNYPMAFREEPPLHQIRKNAIPSGGLLRLNQLVTSDLIRREDIKKFQTGIRELLKEHRAGDRFLAQPIESLDDICDRIDQMDSTQISWYEGYTCGAFDFRNEYLESDVDYFILQIQNVNSSYLGVEFQIHLTEAKTKEIDEIIQSNFREVHGYAKKMLASRRNGGAFDAYSVRYYNDDAIKADRIYEWVNCIEWKFYNALKHYLPFVLHNKGIIPPRIEVYYTNIDYRDDNWPFWESIGISRWNGQFIDDRQKMFFVSALSGRYEKPETKQRLMYVIKDDDIPVGQLESVKDEVYYHIEMYSKYYFRFMFLDILSHDVGKIILRYKQKLDRIKLKRRRLIRVLRQRYYFEREIDYYMRYIKDDIWQHSLDILEKDIYCGINTKTLQTKVRGCYSCKRFCNDAMMAAKKTDETVGVIRDDYADKEIILQHLTDYRNVQRNWWISVGMLLVSSVTLFFVLFPDKAIQLSDGIRKNYAIILEWARKIKMWIHHVIP